MKQMKLTLITLANIGLLLLTACNSNEPQATTTNTPTKTAKTQTVENSETTSKTNHNHNHKTKGGQVVEVGKYHLEFVAAPETKGTHLDFYLFSGDKHEIIPNAKVTAQITTPKGEQKTLNLAYDKEGKHYHKLLPEATAGEYKVVVLSDIEGEKVNGRFSFKR